MPCTRLPFPALPWIAGPHALERKKSVEGAAGTLLEFAPGFSDPNWCERGHAGYVLSGALRLELQDAGTQLEAGEGFVIDPGTAHRATNPGTEPVRLFIMSWG